MILILTDESDKLQSYVIPVLKNKCIRHFRFNTADFPRTVKLTIRFDNDGAQPLLLQTDGNAIDLCDIRTVWYRRPGGPVAEPSVSPADQHFIVRESSHVLDALWHLLKNRFWVNPYQKSNAAEHKPHQLQIARSVGLEVPRTLITNDPREVLDFYNQCGQRVIYKCFSQYARMVNEKGCGIYTNRITREELEARFDEIRLAPCLFQEYVPKKVELRITVIGRKIFTSSIDSQATAHAKDDWRRYMFVEPARQCPSDIPEALKRRIHDMMGQMGLVFGCFDFVLTPDGRYVFLELNPNGQWYWVERETGLPLLDNFVEMLAQGTPEYADPLRLEVRAT